MECVWITDRGMASADNLAWLRQTGRRCIIGAPPRRGHVQNHIGPKGHTT
jgi:hypothetical protein